MKIMTKFQKIKIFRAILPAVGCWLLIAASANAATLYLYPVKDEVAVGDVFQLEARLDTEGKDINAIDASLNFSSGVFDFKDFSDGGSIVSLWAERPKLEGNEISFSGLMPGGFRGDGLVLKLIFKAKSGGRGLFFFGEKSSVLLNDGRGTSASLKFSNFQFFPRSGVPPSGTIFNEFSTSSEQILNYDDDRVPPEVFEPKIVRLDNVFSGKYFIVFSAQDKGSGIDYYEVFDGGEWIRAESPYVLKNQNFKKNLQVKAVDKAGNERIERVSPGKTPRYANYLVWVIIIGGLFFALWKVIKRKSFI